MLWWWLQLVSNSLCVDVSTAKQNTMVWTGHQWRLKKVQRPCNYCCRQHSLQLKLCILFIGSLFLVVIEASLSICHLTIGRGLEWVSCEFATEGPCLYKNNCASTNTHAEPFDMRCIGSNNNALCELSLYLNELEWKWKRKSNVNYLLFSKSNVNYLLWIGVAAGSPYAPSSDETASLKPSFTGDEETSSMIFPKTTTIETIRPMRSLIQLRWDLLGGGDDGEAPYPAVELSWRCLLTLTEDEIKKMMPMSAAVAEVFSVAVVWQSWL